MWTGNITATTRRNSSCALFGSSQQLPSVSRPRHPPRGSDQNTRQQIEQLVTTYRENWNNHNAAGIAGLYTKDGVLVSQAPRVVKTGTQEIAQQYETIFKTMSHNDAATAEVSPLGTDSVFSVGEYHLSGQGQSGPAKVDGHWTAVYVHEGGTWKIRLLTAVPDLPPAPAPPAR
jgi:uncharacterized protein (TIGR02246 family)